MKKGILKILCTWLMLVAIMQLLRGCFIVIYRSLTGVHTIGDFLDILFHGLAMDGSVAGYFTVVPALLTIAMSLTAGPVPRLIEKAWYWVTGAILALVTTADAALYGYWDFRLDMTPLFYLSTSPSSALASAEWWMVPLALIAVIVLTTGIYYALRFTVGNIIPSKAATPRDRATSVAGLTLVTALLFIPIRGGVTVSTMNLSRAYFSDNQRFNHAAINPVFSLLYSATHQDNFDTLFRFNDDKTQQEIMGRMADRPDARPDTTLLTTDRPDICLIIMESFSAHLMPSLGGDPIATRLDSLSGEGVLFTNFYANSFRTDRGLPAILSGFPGQPTTSVMKHVEKAEHLPSLARSLNSAGYRSGYYYGGDINFTNMLAYLVNGGFSTIVRDTDFPLAQRTGKWGAHDGPVFERALRDLHATDDTPTPRFTVIQTSSSHEPFEVPFADPRFADSPRKNAFAYADSCITAFVDSLSHSPRWERTLVILVPDHQGVYPENMEECAARHHVPLILAGGALKERGVRATPVGSQVDIAATLLGMLGIGHSEYTFSKDLLNPASPRFAFFTSSSIIGMVDSEGHTGGYNIESEAVTDPSQPARLTEEMKAYLQSIYTALDNL